MKSKTKENIIAIIVILLISIVIVMLVSTSVTKQQEQLNIEVSEKKIIFHKNTKFLCAGLMKGPFYIVSKSQNWSIHKSEYFKKGDVLLAIKHCEKESS